ncbi:hypothetical protein ES703_85902 [subsurface metagenome]
MAKLKAPLFSLGAAGQLGKALVYFGWKGLDVVREYVIPANPNTTAQQTQRGYLRDAVAAIHAEQALAALPLNADDVTAYSLWASVVQAATTWFNQMCRHWIDITIDGKTPAIFREGVSTPGANKIHVTIYCNEINGVDITAATFFYGTSRTALIHSVAAGLTPVALLADADLSPLVTGTKYFWQLRVDTGENCEGARSGIYYAKAA